MSNYLLIKKQAVEEKYSPWIALYCDLMKKDVFVLEPKVVESIPLWYERHSRILNKDEKEALESAYGLFEEEISDVATEKNNDPLKGALVKTAMEKLGYQKYAMSLRYGNLTGGFFDEAEEKIIQDMLLKEYLTFVDNEKMPCTFIRNVLEHNKISLSYTSTTIDELELSMRSYNTLKRNGIHQLQELEERFFGENKYPLRNLGKRSYEEILEKYKAYKETRDYTVFETLTVKIGNEKDSYKFLSENKESVLKQIFWETIFPQRKEIILGQKMSPRLLNILLLQGWLYLDDIADNKETVFSYLDTAGFSAEKRELEIILNIHAHMDMDDYIVLTMDEELQEAISNGELKVDDPFSLIKYYEIEDPSSTILEQLKQRYDELGFNSYIYEGDYIDDDE